jgi:hypothetical protein
VLEFFETVVSEEITDDERQRNMVLKEITEQIKSQTLNSSKTIIKPHDAIKPKSNDQTPNFMQKFISGSQKLIEENCVEYFSV